MSDLPGNIQKLREDLGLSRAAFADKLGVNQNKIKHIETGYQRADHEFLTILSSKFDVSIDMLLGINVSGQNLTKHNEVKTSTSEFIPIQRFDVCASAGHGALNETEMGTGHYAFNRSWLERRGLTPNNLAVIAVRGDSMEPELHNKDLILLDRSQIKPDDGDLYVVRHSEGLYVKRIQLVPGNVIKLRSTNNLYEAIEVKPDESTDLEFVGKVVASMHEW